MSHEAKMAPIRFLTVLVREGAAEQLKCGAGDGLSLALRAQRAPGLLY